MEAIDYYNQLIARNNAGLTDVNYYNQYDDYTYKSSTVKTFDGVYYDGYLHDMIDESLSGQKENIGGKNAYEFLKEYENLENNYEYFVSNGDGGNDSWFNVGKNIRTLIDLSKEDLIKGHITSFMYHEGVLVGTVPVVTAALIDAVGPEIWKAIQKSWE